MSPSVEELSASLVREFLSRKGLKLTLAKMDEELPRTSESISNRVALARAMHIERLMKKNKELASPYRTMIEVIANFLVERSGPERKNLTTTTSPVKRETQRKSSEAEPTLSIQSNTDSATPLELSGTQRPLNTKPLSQRRSISEGMLGWDGGLMRGDRSMACDFAQEIGGNPVTKSLDVDILKNPQGSVLKLTSADLSASVEVQKTGNHPTIDGSSIAKPHGSRGISPSLQKPPKLFSGVQATAFSKGTKQHKFKPRSFAEMEAELEESQPILFSAKPESSSQQQEARKLSLPEAPPSIVIEHLNDTGLAMGKSGRHKAMKPSHSTGSLGKVPSSTSSQKQVSMELLYEDLEDLDLSIGVPAHERMGPSRMPVFSTGRPISLETAKALRELIFGSAKGPSFNAEWRKQNFFFCDLPQLEYGLIQHKGGPCGVLACVQAHILKHLLFSDPENDLTSSPQPSPEERSTALVAAMSDMLWKAGGRTQAVVALPSSSAAARFMGSVSYKPDQLTERLVLHHFSDYITLKSFIDSRLAVFQDGTSCGCILFLFSAVLSRGIKMIQGDMDEKGNRMIGAHGYCCQEMVNLLLTGVAVSNVFDDNVELDSGGKTTHILKGIHHQSEIGLLSLFEHYGSCTVGSHYKEPVFPIWVVCSESHFTVLFCPQRKLLQKWQLEQMFDLYYFDGLANQDEPIRLTVDNTQDTLPVSGEELTPPLELCLQTKWKTATVDWNGTEPIL